MKKSHRIGESSFQGKTSASPDEEEKPKKHYSRGFRLPQTGQNAHDKHLKNTTAFHNEVGNGIMQTIC